MADGADSIAALTSPPYHEPSMVTVLVLVSFLLFVNIARSVASTFAGAGLLGEIIIGFYLCSTDSLDIAIICPIFSVIQLDTLAYYYSSSKVV